jgi:hypothetical protein
LFDRRSRFELHGIRTLFLRQTHVNAW